MPVAAQGSVNVAGGRRRQLSGGSIPDSLDWAWMSSQPDSGPSSLLQHLLRGEWPASIEPRPGTGASVGPPLSGWASGQSPLRPPRRWGRRGAESPLPQPLPQCAEDEAGPEEGQEQLEGIIPEQEGLQQEQQVLADAELQPQLLVQQVQQASSGQVPAAVGTQRDTAAELGSDAGEMRHWPAPAGLILLHPGECIRAGQPCVFKLEALPCRLQPRRISCTCCKGAASLAHVPVRLPGRRALQSYVGHPFSLQCCMLCKPGFASPHQPAWPCWNPPPHHHPCETRPVRKRGP